MIDVITELRNIKGVKAKIEYLSKFSDNELLKLVLRMTYDKSHFNYRVTLKQVMAAPRVSLGDGTLVGAVAWMACALDKLYTTGDVAIALHSLIESVSDEEADILKCIINHDLRIGLTVKSINKAIPELIHKSVYMGCSDFRSGHPIKYPAFVQANAKGDWRELVVENGVVTLWSRSGDRCHNEVLESQFADLPEGSYIGCLTTVPDVKFTVYDYIGKGLNDVYHKRFSDLNSILPVANAEVVFSEMVNSDTEAFEASLRIRNAYKSSTVLKDLFMPFKPGISDLQLII